MIPLLAVAWSHDIGESLRQAFLMFWVTLWPLVLGFGLSGAVQAFVTKEQMSRAMGDHRAASVVRATGFGMASSSCSYAATAMAKSLFQKGADFVTAMVFMFASTNLVIELGVVLIILLGWQFAAAELSGGLIMVTLLALTGGSVIHRAGTAARRRLAEGGAGPAGAISPERDDEPAPDGSVRPGAARLRHKSGWAAAARYTVADLTMVRRELLVGYLVAGFLAALVPAHAWNDVFVHGHRGWTSLENAVVGPFVAIISFVCSVGNVPLAAALWKGGISFGGVVSFIFADLITFPLLLIYRRYYGTRLALRLLAWFWVVMAVAGLAVEGLARAAGLVPAHRPGQIVTAQFRWDYTTVLNLVFLAVFAVIYRLARTARSVDGGPRYAIDPTCGMQVRSADAPARTDHQGHEYYFCSDHCRDLFLHDTGTATTRVARRADVGTVTSMRFVHSSVVDAPLSEVFAWHSRPGAATRLTPPWLPVRVLAEAESLRDGRAVLGFPGGVKWVADHQADGYDPPHRFVDELTSEPLRTALRWRHVHRFDEEDPASTRVTDTVDSTVPAGRLRPMFAYRERELAGDLAAHRWALGFRPAPLRVALTGSSGLVGSNLAAFLSSGGHEVVHLVRRAPGRPGERPWRPEDPDPGVLKGIDVVIHLAGASIAGRFTDEHKRAIRDSRVGPTAALAGAVARAAAAGGGPTSLVTASAVGFYGPDRGDEVLSEQSGRGDGFLADLVADWEAATAPATDAGIRVVHMRTGIVQSPRGGTLRLLRPLFAAGLGGRLGSGEQWTPWIGIDDLVDAYCRAIVDPELSGPVNAVAPLPVRNHEYTATLARVLHRPAWLPVPAFGPRLVLGAEGVRELAEASQRVYPDRLLAGAHPFRHADLESTLRHVLGRAAPPTDGP